METTVSAFLVINAYNDLEIGGTTQRLIAIIDPWQTEKLKRWIRI